MFYLVNLALFLPLYSDGENLPLPLWDFVALVGRALLAEAALAGAGLAGDPVWALLAELAGRPADEPPGAGFAPPADWRLPPAWLIPFAPGPAQHRAASGRLVIWHAEGFPIVDVSAHGELSAQLAAELAPYASCAGGPAEAAPVAHPASRPVPPAASPPLPSSADSVLAPAADPLFAPPSDPLSGWLARLLPYLRARLRRALGVDDHELPARLLVHRAHVHATATHLDVVLALDALPIELRFAGLDRDPGWVPAAGRFLAFHFE